MRKILVTGGLGFLGYHLIKSLIQKYHNPKITVIDNLSSSKIDFGDLYLKVNAIIDDLQNVHQLDDRYDDIYHLASPVGSLGILKKNGYVAKEILELTYKAIELATKNDAKLLFVSSSEVYGYSGIHDENAIKKICNSYGTRMEYALGKYTAEVVLKNLSFTKNFKFNIIRPFNIIGEQQSSSIGFVVPSFFENALSERPIKVFNDGMQKRAFCYADDIVDAMIKIQESEITDEIFNIGNDTAFITINELAQKIKKMCNSGSEIIHVDPVKVYGNIYIEAFDKIPNLNKIKNSINWSPKFDLDKSLTRIFNYYSKKYESIVCESGI